MDDGSCLAFFEVPGKPFDFKRQDTLNLHIALGVEPDVFDRMLDKARAKEVEVRGPVDHGFVRSIYMRDPNGYVVELTATTGVRQEIMDPTVSKPNEALARWQAAKTTGQPGQSSAA
jgi:catechol-2,3-dioxygenase